MAKKGRNGEKKQIMHEKRKYIFTQRCNDFEQDRFKPSVKKNKTNNKKRCIVFILTMKTKRAFTQQEKAIL